MAARRRAAKPGAHPRNELLKAARLERGWGQNELAKQLLASMAAVGDPTTAVTDDQIYNWETGRTRPQDIHRKHLVLVFGIRASELGLLTPEELESLPPAPVAPMLGGQSIVDALAGQVLDQVFQRLGDVAAHMLTRETQVRRLHARLEARRGANRGSVVGLSLDPKDVATCADAASMHERWYQTKPAGELLDYALDQLKVGVGLLKPARADTAGFRSLASAVARQGLLAGRLAFFDLGLTSLADACFEVARDASLAADDAELTAAICFHHAFVPGFAGNKLLADQALDTGLGYLRYTRSPLLRAWAHSVAGEIYGATGRADQGLNSIRKAQDALDAIGENPSWLDWFDRSRFLGFAGKAHLVAGNKAKAAALLSDGVELLGESSAKQRPVALFDLAVAQSDDADLAADTARRGFEELLAAPYAVGLDRLDLVVQALQGTPFAAEIDERRRGVVLALPSANS